MTEQYPLLCEEVSDEERPRLQYRRRQCPRTLRGRVKYHLKGAALVMSRWPGHWRSALTYLWIGIGMISLYTFVIYNTFVMTSLVQQTMPYMRKTSGSYPQVSVNMHLFGNNKTTVENYIPRIEIFANKYKNFTFNIYIVANDTIGETSNFTDKTNNDVALNSLWDNDMHDMYNYANSIPSKGYYKNINLKCITLSQILNNSPLVHQWKNLPHQFIPFLVRAVSVWNLGGIAVNPDIFILNSPLAAYVDKFNYIIKSFKKTKENKLPDLERPALREKHNKHLPKVNNIRDIINALETRNSTESSGEETLYAAESENSFSLSNNGNKLMTVQKDSIADTKITGLMHRTNIDPNKTPYNTEQSSLENKKDRLSDLLPKFLDYFFHNKKSNKTIKTTTIVEELRSPTDELKKTKLNATNDSQERNFKSADDYRPKIVSAKGITKDYVTNKDKAMYQDVKPFKITVDLKGNIIASETSCHAFLGNLFLNSIHHDKAETIADFITKELHTFCKGFHTFHLGDLSSCVGVDFIQL